MYFYFYFFIQTITLTFNYIFTSCYRVTVYPSDKEGGAFPAISCGHMFYTKYLKKSLQPGNGNEPEFLPHTYPNR